MIDSWLLISLPAGGGGDGQDQSAPSWCRGVAGVRLQSPSSCPPTLSRILEHACVARAPRVKGRECPLICCGMRPVNSCCTCSDARNISQYNSSRYDSIRYTQYRFRYDTDPIIIRSLVIAKVQLLKLRMSNLRFPNLHMRRNINDSCFVSCCFVCLQCFPAHQDSKQVNAGLHCQRRTLSSSNSITASECRWQFQNYKVEENIATKAAVVL